MSGDPKQAFSKLAIERISIKDASDYLAQFIFDHLRRTDSAATPNVLPSLIGFGDCDDTDPDSEFSIKRHIAIARRVVELLVGEKSFNPFSNSRNDTNPSNVVGLLGVLADQGVDLSSVYQRMREAGVVLPAVAAAASGSSGGADNSFDESDDLPRSVNHFRSELVSSATAVYRASLVGATKGGMKQSTDFVTTIREMFPAADKQSRAKYTAVRNIIDEILSTYLLNSRSLDWMFDSKAVDVGSNFAKLHDIQAELRLALRHNNPVYAYRAVMRFCDFVEVIGKQSTHHLLSRDLRDFRAATLETLVGSAIEDYASGDLRMAQKGRFKLHAHQIYEKIMLMTEQRRADLVELIVNDICKTRHADFTGRNHLLDWMSRDRIGQEFIWDSLAASIANVFKDIARMESYRNLSLSSDPGFAAMLGSAYAFISRMSEFSLHRAPAAVTPKAHPLSGIAGLAKNDVATVEAMAGAGEPSVISKTENEALAVLMAQLPEFPELLLPTQVQQIAYDALMATKGQATSNERILLAIIS